MVTDMKISGKEKLYLFNAAAAAAASPVAPPDVC